MYLHIGNNIMIKKEEILFLLDYEGLKGNKIFQKLLNNIEDKEDISDQEPKTVVVIKKNKKIKAYLSNISAITLAKRNRI